MQYNSAAEVTCVICHQESDLSKSESVQTLHTTSVMTDKELCVFFLESIFTVVKSNGNDTG